MKHNLFVNQREALDLGVQNITQAHILDLLTSCSSWAKPITTDDGVFYWVARQMICQELPLLKIKPDTAYRHLKALHDGGFIEYTKQGKKDLVRLSKKGRSYYRGSKSESVKSSEINPTKHGNNSAKRSDLNPTDPTTKSNPTTKDHNNDPKFSEFWEIYQKPIGKKPSYQLWQRLSEKTKDLILERLPDFVAHHDQVEYRPHPRTFLNQERWLDGDYLNARKNQRQERYAVQTWDLLFNNCIKGAKPMAEVFSNTKPIREALKAIGFSGLLDIKMMPEQKVHKTIKPQFINAIKFGTGSTT